MITREQSKGLNFLIESKKELKIELEDIYQSTAAKLLDFQRLKLRNQSCALKQHQSKTIEQTKNLKIMNEKKKKMEELNDKFALETFKLNDIIGKQKKHIDALWEFKEKLNNDLQGKETELRKYQNQAEKIFEMKTRAAEVQKEIIEKLRKDLKNLRENQEKMELGLKNNRGIEAEDMM